MNIFTFVVECYIHCFSQSCSQASYKKQFAERHCFTAWGDTAIPGGKSWPPHLIYSQDATTLWKQRTMRLVLLSLFKNLSGNSKPCTATFRVCLSISVKATFKTLSDLHRGMFPWFEIQWSSWQWRLTITDAMQQFNTHTHCIMFKSEAIVCFLKVILTVPVMTEWSWFALNILMALFLWILAFLIFRYLEVKQEYTFHSLVSTLTNLYNDFTEKYW